MISLRSQDSSGTGRITTMEVMKTRAARTMKPNLSRISAVETWAKIERAKFTRLLERCRGPAKEGDLLMVGRALKITTKTSSSS